MYREAKTYYTEYWCLSLKDRPELMFIKKTTLIMRNSEYLYSLHQCNLILYMYCIQVTIQDSNYCAIGIRRSLVTDTGLVADTSAGQHRCPGSCLTYYIKVNRVCVTLSSLSWYSKHTTKSSSVFAFELFLVLNNKLYIGLYIYTCIYWSYRDL